MEEIKRLYYEDTIVAPATAPGIAALSIIRLSGPEAISVVNRLFVKKDLEDEKSHTLHYGLISDEGQPIDEVVVSLFRAPGSYTGEDIAEISCHGSPFVVEQIIRACFKYGARLAEPGEFTQRAFLNGKMDLTQAEAVSDMVAALSDSAHKAALNNLRGGFSKKLKVLREKLIHFAALMELELDFGEEDVEFADRTQLYHLLEEAEKEIKRLVLSFRFGNVVKNGIQVAIVGKPNAGKSTLLNALLQEDRAIVSEIAGTTRDTIEEVLNIRGLLFRLIDTAGIRDHTTDDIEKSGISRSRKKMESADVVLYILDVSNERTEIEQEISFLKNQSVRYLIIGNKMDVASKEALEEVLKEFPEMIAISAKKLEHIERLKDWLYEYVIRDLPSSEDSILTNTRHLQALEKTLESLASVRQGLDEGISGDLITPDIRQALFFLGSITGEVQTDRDILGAIFSKFCIGK